MSDSDDSDGEGVDFDIEKLGPIDISPTEHKLQVSFSLAIVENVELIWIFLLWYSIRTVYGTVKKARRN